LLDALEAAVAASDGKWLARMDSDDRCASDRLARQMALLESGDCEVVSCRLSLVGALGDGMQRYVDWVNGLDTPQKVARQRFVESPVVQPTVVMAKSLFLEAGGYRRNGFAEDYDLWLRLLEMGARFAKVRESLYQWHDRPDRLTRSDPRFEQRQILELKAAALARLSRVRKDGVVIAGAGPTGKRLGRSLKENGVALRGFFEVSPRRIGGRCQGVPVAGPEDFGRRWRAAVLLGAVGSPGGRDKVRQLAKQAGYREGEDFWACC
jgi:glycosyltransferase involved in cell wall biosynthesis